MGLGLHEESYIGKYGREVFKPGMILCIEPIHVVPGIMGFQLEDEIFVVSSSEGDSGMSEKEVEEYWSINL